MEFPPKPVPQTPVGLTKLTLGVEESRAQRHQRQQNRFRDRGGFVTLDWKKDALLTPLYSIFKPSNRNTLVDILMGRRAPSPKKSTRRSASRSPSKKDKTPLTPERSIDTDKMPRNDSAVSPAKAPKKPPKASVEGRSSVLHLPFLCYSCKITKGTERCAGLALRRLPLVYAHASQALLKLTDVHNRSTSNQGAEQCSKANW